MSNRLDIYQQVTDRIVAAIEAGEARAEGWTMPWHRSGHGTARPTNAASKKAYRGINTVALWAAAEAGGYSNGIWATFKQWQDLGCGVRKGEKGSMIVFWKMIESASEGENEEGATREQETRLFARASWVFNADQVDGYQPPALPAKPEAEVIDDAERMIAGTGAAIHHGGDKACYIPSRDEIRLPLRDAFRATATSSATESYYSTVCHELAHWTGHESRLARDLLGRFGSERYAGEELVAELAAAMVLAELGIAPTPRLDHAQYVAGWLRALKGDKRAIFIAAGLAQKAADFIRGEGA